MGCQTEVALGDNLVFSVTTHDPDTGVLTDADALPTWRLYEDETAVPILNGNMAFLDAINTTGFYTELIACTAANGFEARRSYTIYIEATVGGDTGGICYGFRCLADLPFATGTEFTYTVTDSATGNPVDGVEVWISTDLAGANIIWYGVTDAFGVARDVHGLLPTLDPGTYYFWKQLAGYIDDDNPDVENVS